MRVSFGKCLLDSETRELFADGEVVHVQPKAFALLEILLAARPKALTKDVIHERLWPGTFVSDGTLTSLVAEIRNAIGDEARKPRFIRTVQRHGYAFCGTAREAGERAAPPSGQKSMCWLARGRRRFALALGESIIGRDPGAAVFLDDRSVSRRHARIFVTEDSATLEDLGSKNGTQVEGRKVASAVALADEAQIRIGSVSLTFRIFPLADSTQTAAGR